MPTLISCFGCYSPDLAELGRDELKALYEKSIALNGGRLIVHGIFARADTKNNNKRIYPKSILKREVARFEREHISKGTALGELDHPSYASRYFKFLNLPNISHQVLEVLWKGEQLWGSIEILPTPSGLLLWELYSQGIKLGVSSRGWASLRPDKRRKCVYVDDDFELITFDFVTEPSTEGAYLVPLNKPYKLPVPSQSKSVQVAQLGHGVCALEQVPLLPPVATLAARINELRVQHLKPAPTSRLKELDNLLVYSHYIAFQDAPYLDRESQARDFQSHLAMFASHGHLAHKAELAKRADLSAIIMQELMAKGKAALDVGPTDLAMVGDNAAHKRSVPPYQTKCCIDIDCQEQHQQQQQPHEDAHWSLKAVVAKPSGCSSSSRQGQPADEACLEDKPPCNPDEHAGTAALHQVVGVSQGVAGHPGRVHPLPSTQQQQQSQFSMKELPPELVLELQRIKCTLASYAVKNSRQCQALQAALQRKAGRLGGSKPEAL